MEMSKIRKKASGLGLKSGKMKKGELIRAIQSAEGNSQCFGSAGGECDQTDCCWRKDCLA